LCGQIRGDFVSDNKKNSRLYIDTLFDLILSSDTIKSRDPERFLRDFISFLKKICLSRVRQDILIHLLVERASCSSLLKVDLGLSHASVHRELRNLIHLGLVQRVIPYRQGRGRPITIYAIKGYVPEDILRVTTRISKSRTPAYSNIQSITQLILAEYLEPRGLSEITWREIVVETKAQCKGFYSGDIARLVARELSSDGIKVWR